MTAETSTDLTRRLRRAGLSSAAIRAAWPPWWSREAETSQSAKIELRFAIARNLGLEPASLFEETQPRFVWRGEARFKRLAVADEFERDAIESFGKALGSVVVAALPSGRGSLLNVPAQRLRATILGSGVVPYVRLADLLILCWGVGVPVLQLRLFPAEKKGMAAMTVFVGETPVILLAKETRFPGQLAFYLAHEIGHVALNQVHGDAVLVDMDAAPTLDEADREERDADAYALELLTGTPQPTVLSRTGYASGAELARVSQEAAAELQIEPGTLALCFAYSTGRWGTAMRAMRGIYPNAVDLWQEVNHLAVSQLSLDDIPRYSRHYLLNALGLNEP